MKKSKPVYEVSVFTNDPLLEEHLKTLLCRSRILKSQ